MGWQEIVLTILPAAASAGAGTIASPGGPFVMAASGELAKDATKQLLEEVLRVEADHRKRMEELSNSLSQKLDTLIDGPMQAARNHLEAAANLHPDRRSTELWAARYSLFLAHGSAGQDMARRALVCEELAVVYGLLGIPDEVKLWLVRAYDAITEALRREGGMLRAQLEANRQPMIGTRGPKPERCGMTIGPHTKQFVFSIKTSIAFPALVTVAVLTAEAARIRSLCGLVDELPPASETWAWPDQSSSEDRHDNVLDRMLLTTGRSPSDRITVQLPEGEAAQGLARRLFPVSRVHTFCVSSRRYGVPRLVGNCVELGNWDPARAPSQEGPFVFIWRAEKPLEYRWAIVQEDGPTIWEPGPKRVDKHERSQVCFAWIDLWGHNPVVGRPFPGRNSC